MTSVEINELRAEVDRLTQELSDLAWHDGPNGPLARMRRAVTAHEASRTLYDGLRVRFDEVYADRTEALELLRELARLANDDAPALSDQWLHEMDALVLKVETMVKRLDQEVS